MKLGLNWLKVELFWEYLKQEVVFVSVLLGFYYVTEFFFFKTQLLQLHKQNMIR